MNATPASDTPWPALTRRLRTAKTVGASLWGALLFELVAVEAVRASVRPFFGLARLAGSRTIFRYGIYLGAAAVILAIRILNGRRLGRIGSEPDEAARRRIFSTSVASLVLADLPAVLGLVLFLAGGYNRDFYALLFVSMLLLFMYFPRGSVWQARLTEPGRTCPF
ncbi:MAG: hypothetical protein NTZ26_06560 [Candidatus Aminicenantes bacterium]|nr:hypothetical protein [Candidatus Aminicenantes bacterium]